MTCRLAAVSLFAFFSMFGSAMADECPGNPDALGTSRVLSVDPFVLKRIGTIQYPETLPLEDHEVVLTFDDGPIPPNTGKVLDALAAECVKATFFIVGQEATAHPALLQRAYREGHTIGTHTEHHAHLGRIGAEKAAKEIDAGIASVRAALGDAGAPAPFFRIPYFDPASAAEEHAIHLGLTIWSADLHASDWNRLKPEQVVALALQRLEHAKKGIILLHDIHERTALALPILLKELKKRGYKVVHAVPAAPAQAQAAAKPNPWAPIN
jgi:peptidoglycan/xylan/chitin deacetylase (PgdA/CDA1 family)